MVNFFENYSNAKLITDSNIFLKVNEISVKNSTRIEINEDAYLVENFIRHNGVRFFYKEDLNSREYYDYIFSIIIKKAEDIIGISDEDSFNDLMNTFDLCKEDIKEKVKNGKLYVLDLFSIGSNVECIYKSAFDINGDDIKAAVDFLVLKYNEFKNNNINPKEEIKNYIRSKKSEYASLSTQTAKDKYASAVRYKLEDTYSNYDLTPFSATYITYLLQYEDLFND